MSLQSEQLTYTRVGEKLSHRQLLTKVMTKVMTRGHGVEVVTYEPNDTTYDHDGSELRVVATKYLSKAIRELGSSGTLLS